MWQRWTNKPTASIGQGDTKDSNHRGNRYTLVPNAIDWGKIDYRPPTRCARIANFVHKEFCALNREIASEAQGPASAVLFQQCARIWEGDPIPLDSVCWNMARDIPEEHQTGCFAQIEALAQDAKAKSSASGNVWHMPLDETTVDDARHHCGMPVGDLANTVRRIKDDLEIALMCERNAAAGAPRGIDDAIHRFCHETKPDAEAAIRRMAQEVGAGDFTVACLQKRLGLASKTR
ncbi:hypothetical protein pqer_cds_701 [Pandoravirus quercus]|uniref:Uncharacterized protein n=2 Tax=Pandoravirus TaxID=2060084 RepID=A0A2U7U9K6_9VIRU|nr:hypothetical protein pqer_cds_701 [Pandoravirus quercus]AVK75123.1 hypothetical protein pqer_cds_701 [Pandoravirus quercus]QBZ81286.1 hypothetical protein pclt_cds_700 [Pandoravirus celtis]